MSWNVRALRDGAAGVARELAALDADLVVLQEAPRLLGWRTSRALLARRTGLRLASRAWGGGNLLLVAPSVTVLSSRGVLLPRRRGLHRRAVVLAELDAGGRRLVLAGTHLDLDADARLDSARRVRALLPAGPLVLGADVNAQPGAPAWDALSDGLSGGSPGPTFPASGPRRRIDALLSTLPLSGLEVVDTGAASDHLALRAELAL